ncbi:putative inorganic phosphate cotransporter [Episyrphus balteatus]|uniref:putative inorganic phosphate cotransporter n=1 Tax=Episyrphus balteatus TaxID=286459 RepID=UPI0024858160|nr:putative inorganic phosphate cotransporter [Episyrphus balteatus]
MTVKSFSLIKRGPIFGVRHVQALFLFICCTLGIQMRVNVSVGIVAMTNANSTNADFPEFVWSEAEKSYMLSSFFWGSLCTQFLGGYLSSQYGAKQLLLACTLGVSLLSLLTPTAVIYGGWQLFCVVRVFQGIFQGVMFPCFYSHLAKWCPVEERNLLGGITQTGMDIGSALGFAVSGLVAASDLGWPGMFYIPGILGILWSILWIHFGANSPEECRIISLAEKKKIQLSLEQPINSSRNKAVPWKAIFTSVPFLALTVVKIAIAASFFTLMQQVPAYIHGIFKVGIKMNAVYSAIPYVFMCVLSYVFLIVADTFTKGDDVNSIACWIPAAALVAMGYVSVEHVATSVTLLIIAVSACAAQVIGSSLNHIDLAPDHAGILFGITNTLANAVGIVSPLFVGIIVSDEGNRLQWRVVFIVIAVILFIGNLIYVIFGKMEKQPWNESQDEVVDSKNDVEKAPGATTTVEELNFPRFKFIA